MSGITRIPIPGAPSSSVSMGAAGNGIVMMTQIPSGEGGGIVEGGVEAQTKQIFENYRSGLAAFGAGLEHVLHVTVYLVDIDELGAFARVWAEYYQSDGPNRVSLEVSRLAKPEILVETTAVVALP